MSWDRAELGKIIMSHYETLINTNKMSAQNFRWQMSNVTFKFVSKVMFNFMSNTYPVKCHWRLDSCILFNTDTYFVLKPRNANNPCLMSMLTVQTSDMRKSMSCTNLVRGHFPEKFGYFLEICYKFLLCVWNLNEIINIKVFKLNVMP